MAGFGGFRLGITFPRETWDTMRDWFGRGTGQHHQTRRMFLDRVGEAMVNEEIPRAFAASGPGWKSLVIREGRPLLDSGKLSKSFKYTVTPNGKAIDIGSDKVQFPTHQFGAEGADKRVAVRAYSNLPGGPYLHIPSNQIPVASRRRLRWEDFPGSFLLKRGDGWLWVQPAGVSRRKNLRIVAFLKKAVEIPARPIINITDAVWSRFMGFWRDILLMGTERL